MSNFLKQSTASQSRTIGPFVSDTDFKTVQTGLTIANTDIKLLVNGGASANKNSGGGTHRANGHYGVTFDATDTATVGEIEVSVVVSGALPVFKTFFVLEEAVYDELFGASALGYVANAPVNVAQFGGSNLTSSSGIPEVKVASIAANAITATSINADAITAAKIADGAIDRATFAADTGHQSIRSNTAASGAASTITLDASASATDDLYKSAWIVLTGGTGAGQTREITGYVGSTKVAAIKPSWATNPDNTSTFAILPAAVVDANVTQFGGTSGVFANGRPSVETTTIGGTLQTARDLGASVLLSSGTGTGQLDFTSGVVKANTTQFNGSNVTSSSGRPEVNATHFGGVSGTFNSGLPSVNTIWIGGAIVNTNSAQLGVNVVNWKGAAAATVDASGYPVVTIKDGTGQGEIATTSGAVDTVTTLTNAPSDSSGVTTLLSRLSALRAGYLDNLSAGAVALASTFTGITSLAQWLGLIAGKQTGNSTARTEVRATGAGSGTFDETTDSVEALRDNMGTAQTGDAYARLGAPAGASVSADVAAVKSDTGAIKAKTDNLPSDPADESLVIAATDAIMSRLGAPAGASVSADIAALPTADQNADAVWEEPLADHSGTSGSTAEQLAAAGAAGDPWATALPGAYSSGQAGKIVGDALDAAVGSRATAADVPTANQNADALLDRADGVETGVTPRGALRLMLAVTAGKLSGVLSNILRFRNVGDTKDRVVSDVSADGRDSVTTDTT